MRAGLQLWRQRPVRMLNFAQIGNSELEIDQGSAVVEHLHLFDSDDAWSHAIGRTRIALSTGPYYGPCHRDLVGLPFPYRNHEVKAVGR